VCSSDLIENGGNGYTQATGTIAGKGVEIEFVVSGGQIIAGVITNEGTGVVATDTIVISGDGNGAIATPIVQPTTCYLTSQKKQELSPDDPLRNEFVRVLRTYETLPGPFIASTRLDEDSVVVTINTRRNIASNITSSETLVGGVWTKTTKKGEDNFVAEEIVETRAIEGNLLADSVIDERDGAVQTIYRTMKDVTTITPLEEILGGFYIKVEIKVITALVAWEVKTERPVPGNPVVKTVIDDEGDIVTETRTLVQSSTITTIITTVGGVYTKTFEDPITDIIAWKVVQVKATQNTMDSYEVSIPDLLPEEFRATLPITTHEDTLIGTASLPTLGTGDLMRKQEQISYNVYRLTVRGRAGITLPQVITNKETTSQFGGGDINVTLTLDLFNNLSLDEGLLVLVPSEIRKLDSQVNGLAVKASKILNDTAWPVTYSANVDHTYGIITPILKQVVTSGSVVGNVSGGVYYEVKAIDKWKSIYIASSIDLDHLPEEVEWFGGQYHSFPPELSDAIIEYAEATCGCVDKFTSVLQANLTQYRGPVKARYREQFYNGPPPDDIDITQFFPQSHVFGFAFASVCGCGSDNTSRVTAIAPQYRIPLCLHDDLSLNVGVSFTWNFSATSPAALPHGSYITLQPHIERWRFGIFRRVITQILVP